MTSDEALAWLFGTQLHGIKLGLENVRRLVAALDIDLTGTRGPRFLHVAGTNGKGSTCAMLDSICRAAGLKTGLFTSPHLVTFRERIRLDGEMISEADVAAGLTAIRKLTADWEHSPTFFEITTALALRWFQDRGAEIVVLETGMGGRLDATNVVTPAVSVITSIDFDHQQYLGDTLAAIAGEKGGIFKEGVPAVSAPQQAEAEHTLRLAAKERGALVLDFIAEPWTASEVGLAGEHQRWNAALAVAALRLAGVHADAATIARGLAGVVWPGRFQQLAPGVTVDGAHNVSAAARLAKTWREIHGDERATIVLGILQDKAAAEICAALAPIAERFILVPVQSPRTFTTEALAEIAAAASPATPRETAATLAEGLTRARALSPRVLVTGSLFLVGEAIAHLGDTSSRRDVSAQ